MVLLEDACWKVLFFYSSFVPLRTDFLPNHQCTLKGDQAFGIVLIFTCASQPNIL